MKNSNDILNQRVIKLFVFGTLRKGQRLGFYLNGAKYLGRYYTEGQLVKATNGSVYIDFDFKNVATIGELYEIDFYSLQRINHLETFSGEFPSGYDLNTTPIWAIKDSEKFDFEEKEKELAFFYRRKNNAVKIMTGDYGDDFQPVDRIRELLLDKKTEIASNELVDNLRQQLSIFETLDS